MALEEGRRGDNVVALTGATDVSSGPSLNVSPFGPHEAHSVVEPAQLAHLHSAEYKVSDLGIDDRAVAETPVSLHMSMSTNAF
jgi:hypothetical protein